MSETLLLRSPAISANRVAFTYAGDIWTVGRDGGDAVRLTTHAGYKSNLAFSPDGQWLAFTGSYDGNTDAFVIPAQGGSPARLTYHPDADNVQGWSPDGANVLIASYRNTPHGYGRFYTANTSDGTVTPLPIPRGERAAFSPDGRRIVFTTVRDSFAVWRLYRGGTMPRLLVFDLETLETTPIPHADSNNTAPVWIGDAIYFLSDRAGTMNLFAYDTRTGETRQRTRHADFDALNASGQGDSVIYEQAGRLHRFDVKAERTEPIPIRVAADWSETRPYFRKVGDRIANMSISPTGVRAVVEARGEILTVPAKKGDIRNISRTPGANERFPAWSPDGKSIAYFSDANGEYALCVRSQDGLEPPKVYPLDNPSFFWHPQWSPDSKRLLYHDKHRNLYCLDISADNPSATLVDTDLYSPYPDAGTLDPAWSPDSRWIAYTRRTANLFRAVFVYDLETGERRRITDGLSDASCARFNPDGKTLIFAASTDVGLNIGWSDMSQFDRPTANHLYAVVLCAADPSPFRPESDEETGKPAEDADKKPPDDKPTEPEKPEPPKEPANVTIDFDGISQRIVAVPVPPGPYRRLSVAPEGKLYYLSGNALQRFDPKERKAEPYLEKIAAYDLTPDGKKLLYRSEENAFGIVETANKATVGDGKLDVSKMEVYVEPLSEWRQIFREAWRFERDFFYDANMHGSDWNALWNQYEPFLSHVVHRSDLNYLIAMMIRELAVSHLGVGGGDAPSAPNVPVGLLGADYDFAPDGVRIARVYTGENWNPDLRAPLTEPGVNVSAGEFLLSVNGQPATAGEAFYGLFAGTADRQTVLRVGKSPDDHEPRTVTVVPVSSERGLRRRAWIEDNRRKVDALTNGRVAYIYMPNTSKDGYDAFNRDFFAHLNREAVILDERFNGGGWLADYVVDILARQPLGYPRPRDGEPYATPNGVIPGPKVMLINEYAGSGGDAMPLYFRRRGIGLLIGTRTWGGLVGISGTPGFLDGGGIGAPSTGLVSPSGEWDAENIGVPPDIEVEMTPKDVIAGRDPQLDKAIEVVMRQLDENPPSRPVFPPHPTRAAK